MASPVRLQIVHPAPDANQRVAAAERVFREVESTCTRFDPESPLMRLNAQPGQSRAVPALLGEALRASFDAYRRTEGRFDPRVLDDLVRAGYDTSFDGREPGSVVTSAAPHESWWARTRRTRAWKPTFDGDVVTVGKRAIDLGGIGKGLAVRWAMEELAGAGDAVMVEAGGDIATTGRGPDGEGWRIGVENPWNVTGDPAVVVDASDHAVATSSVRLRTWVRDGVTQHHLIDPRTGSPADTGLQSVTALASDAAWAEVWSKAAFLEGRSGIRAFADELRLALVWIDAQGNVGVSRKAQDRVVWKVSRVG